MVANVPWGGAILNPRGHHWQDLCKASFNIAVYLIYKRFGSCSFREDFFSPHGSYYKPMTDNDVPVTWPVWTPGTWLSGFIKPIT